MCHNALSSVGRAQALLRVPSPPGAGARAAAPRERSSSRERLVLAPQIATLPSAAACAFLFPDRAFMGKCEPAAVTAGARALGRWLTAVRRAPEVAGCAALVEFLGAAAPVSAAAAGDAATVATYERALAAAVAAEAAADAEDAAYGTHPRAGAGVQRRHLARYKTSSTITSVGMLMQDGQPLSSRGITASWRVGTDSPGSGGAQSPGSGGAHARGSGGGHAPWSGGDSVGLLGGGSGGSPVRLYPRDASYCVTLPVRPRPLAAKCTSVARRTQLSLSWRAATPARTRGMPERPGQSQAATRAHTPDGRCVWQDPMRVTLGEAFTRYCTHSSALSYAA